VKGSPARRTPRALLALLALLAASPAHAEPSDRTLVYAGLGMSIPAYFLGVTVHEGSHAVAAELVGADTLQLHLLPGRNPRNGAFQFGWTRVQGLEGDGERQLFLGAPKIVDAVLLGTYGVLWATDGLPEGRWGHLVVQVLATTFWVDFAKDVLVFNRHNDVVRMFTMAGLDTEWKRLPARVLYAAADAGLAYLVLRGWVDLFEKDDAEAEPLVVPLVAGGF
jgi:hypothetical protein